MKSVLMLLCGSLVLMSAAGLKPARAAAEATATAAWKVEFDAVCGQTDNAAALSVAELKQALARCDALKPQIEALEATPRKVYLKRLQMCRNLFAYLLEGKEKAP